MMIAWRRWTDLLPTHHSQTNPGDGCPWFQQTEHGSICRHFGSHWVMLDCRVETGWINVFDPIKGLVVSLVLKSVQNHQCHLQTELSKPGLAPRKWSSRPRAKRSVASRNSLQLTNSCVSQKVACLQPAHEATIGEAIGLPLAVVANDCATWLSDNSFSGHWRGGGGAGKCSSINIFFMSQVRGAVWVWQGSFESWLKN